MLFIPIVRSAEVVPLGPPALPLVMLFIPIVRSHEEVSFCFPSVTRQLYLVLGVLSVEAVGSHSDTPHSVAFLWRSAWFVAETSINPCKKTHPCTRRDSNPQSQQANGRRPMPYTSRSIGSAEMFLRNHEKRVLSSLVSGFTFL